MKNKIVLKPFLYQSQKNNIDQNKKISQKNTSLSQDKIYFFRTSLFTEKSKNFVQRMNSSYKKYIKNISVNAIISQKKNSDNISIIPKNDNKDTKIILEENNDSKKNNERIININAKKDVYNIKNNNINNVSNINISNNKDKKVYCSLKEKLRKTSNNLINLINNNNKNNDKNNIKSKTEDKKEKIIIEKCYKKSSIILNNIQKCTLFSSLPNVPNVINNINKNINNKSILVNNLAHSQSIINSHLLNVNSKPQNLSQKKQISSVDYKKYNNIKYKLKSKYVSNKDNNNNIASIKSIYDNNTMSKELKFFKPLTKHSKIQSFSIFDENYHISRYKLGKYLNKRNNKYHNKNIISEDRIKIENNIQNSK